MSKEPPQGFRTSGDEPRGTRLVLVRHGEAGCNVAGVVGGPLGCTGLTALGRAQANSLAQRLAFTHEFDDALAAYSSVLARAEETAAIVTKGMGLEVVADCDLCELHPGLADAMTWDEMIAHFGGPDWDLDPTTPFAPQGESWTGFYERCERAFRRLSDQHPEGLVLLFVHGGVIEQAMKWAMGAPAHARLRLRTEHCSLTEIEIFQGEVRLLRYNDRAPRVVTAR
ncbi:MAG: histidine phosphatase family protein [Acidobacteriota bacterium]|nr:histidine phosphatase family protein [Acidobacteriota bacterium]